MRRGFTPLDATTIEAVNEYELGVGDRLGVGRRRRIDVRVGVRADQRLDLQALAADVLHQIGKDREGGDHLQLVLRACGRQRGHQHRQCEHESPHHRHASRCRPGKSCGSTPPTRPTKIETR
jgi:hypothetical protein